MGVQIRQTMIFLLLLQSAIVTGLDNGLSLTPPMGWLSWERFRCNTDCDNDPEFCIGENLFKQMADMLVTGGYKEVGYDTVIIDDSGLIIRDLRRVNFNQIPKGFRVESRLWLTMFTNSD